MADVKRARREAEKAARDALSGTLVGAAGDLGAALAGQQEAAEAVQTARAKGEAIIEAARREAAAVVEAAVVEASAAGESYTAAWNAAKDAGWTPAQLRSMGYSKPPATRKTAPRTSTAGVASTAGEPPEPGDAAAAAVA